MSDNWVVGNLQNALDTWNGKVTELWNLILTSPQNFKGGGIWTAITNVNTAMQGIGTGLLVLFFVIGVGYAGYRYWLACTVLCYRCGKDLWQLHGLEETGTRRKAVCPIHLGKSCCYARYGIDDYLVWHCSERYISDYDISRCFIGNRYCIAGRIGIRY